MSRFGLALLSAFLINHCMPAYAVSDQALRAAYCISVLDRTMAQTQDLSQASKAALERYRSLQIQRTLTPAERQNYTDLERSITVDQPKFRSALQNTRNRLAAYIAPALANSLFREPDDLFGGMGDALSLQGAIHRGEIDFQQCENAEGQSTSAGFCTAGCPKQCGAFNFSCFQACATKCGSPACGRTFACLDPTWLPY